MVNETSNRPEVDKETVLAALKAVKEKGLDVNPFTVADEAKVSAQAVYSVSEYMDLIVKERGSPLVVNTDVISEYQAKVRELESRIRQLQIQNEVLTMQQQTQYDLGHKLGVIEGKKQKAQEIAAQEAARALAGDGDIDLEMERKAKSKRSSTVTGESNVIQISNSGYVPELVGQAPEPPAAAREIREDEGWDTPEVVGEAELLAGDMQEQNEIAARYEPSEIMDNLSEAEAEANAPPQELESGIPTAVFLSAVEDQSASFGDSYSQKVFNAARSGPFVASEFNPMLELSWKDLETVYHFRAKSLKDFSKQIQQSQPPPPPPPPAPKKERVRVPVETNGEMDERHIDEIQTLPSETLTGDNWDKFEEPAQEYQPTGEQYIQTHDESTQEPDALPGGQQASQDYGMVQEPDYSQVQAADYGTAQEPEYAETQSGGFDLDSMDIFEGLDDYSNLEDIEIIQDVQLSQEGNAPSDDELRDLIKNRIRQAKEMASEPREAHQIGAGGAGAEKAEPKGLGSKFIGGKARPKPGETGQAPTEAPAASAPQAGSPPPPPPSQAAQSAPTQGFVRQVPPEIRKACMLLGVRPEEMTIESVTDAWKKQITSPGVHPDQGGDTESAIYLNTAKDTILRWLYDQAPKLGKKWGPGGPKSGPGGKPQPGKGPTPEK
ncbi:MAG: hypothetical protein K2Y39_01780 [Candidatus Obscuribacterales bacterium]|nr:hypothetical protein [Candidatus Obscuribacterales bacterium]